MFVETKNTPCGGPEYRSSAIDVVPLPRWPSTNSSSLERAVSQTRCPQTNSHPSLSFVRLLIVSLLNELALRYIIYISYILEIDNQSWKYEYVFVIVFIFNLGYNRNRFLPFSLIFVPMLSFSHDSFMVARLGDKSRIGLPESPPCD